MIALNIALNFRWKVKMIVSGEICQSVDFLSLIFFVGKKF